MIKMKKILFCVGSLLMISSASYAAQAQTGIVVGGNIGYAMPYGDFRNMNAFMFNAQKKQNGGMAGSFILGYDYAFVDCFSLGLETGAFMTHFSRLEQTRRGNTRNQDNYLMSVPLYLQTKFYVIKGLNLFGKAGYAYNAIIQTRDVTRTNRYSFADGNFDPVIALGVGYKFYSINVFVQYQYNWLKNKEFLSNEYKKGGLGSMALGASYTFA